MQGGARRGGGTLAKAGQGRVSQVVREPGKPLLALEGFKGTLRGFRAGEQILQKRIITQQDPAPVWVPREAPGPGLKADSERRGGVGGNHGVAAEPWSALPASPGAAAPLPGELRGVPAGGLQVCSPSTVSVILYASLNTPGGETNLRIKNKYLTFSPFPLGHFTQSCLDWMLVNGRPLPPG